MLAEGGAGERAQGDGPERLLPLQGGAEIVLPRVELLDVTQVPTFDAALCGCKRVFDFVLAILGLVPLLPIAVVIAVAIKIDSPGQVLFVQTRVGSSNRQFRIFKFRTMVDGTEFLVRQDAALRAEYENNDFKLHPESAQITRVGRFLRKLSMDELPQLLNVVRGDMSLVGNRPLLERELELRPRYDQALYGLARPGMTGLWQVNGRSTVGDIDRIALDRRYVQDWSLLTDLKILARTPLALLRVSQTQ